MCHNHGPGLPAILCGIAASWLPVPESSQGFRPDLVKMLFQEQFGLQDSPKRPAFSPTTPDLVFITAKISLVQPHRDRRSLSLVQAKQDFPTLQLREQQGVASGRQGSPNFRNGLWGGCRYSLTLD